MNIGAPTLDDPRRVAMFAASADTLACIGTVIRAARLRGLPFRVAWAMARALTTDAGVLDALASTEEGWRRAYFREPASSGERALGFLFGDDGPAEDGRPAGRAFGAFV
jgi:hypothetical protein